MEILMLKLIWTGFAVCMAGLAGLLIVNTVDDDFKYRNPWIPLVVTICSCGMAYCLLAEERIRETRMSEAVVVVNAVMVVLTDEQIRETRISDEEFVDAVMVVLTDEQIRETRMSDSPTDWDYDDETEMTDQQEWSLTPVQQTILRNPDVLDNLKNLGRALDQAGAPEQDRSEFLAMVALLPPRYSDD